MKSDAKEADAILNLGPKSRQWLRGIGIRSESDLRRVGAVEAFMALERKGEKVSLNLLYAMEGGLRGLHWTMLSPREREVLKERVGR